MTCGTIERQTHVPPSFFSTSLYRLFCNKIAPLPVKYLFTGHYFLIGVFFALSSRSTSTNWTHVGSYPCKQTWILSFNVWHTSFIFSIDLAVPRISLRSLFLSRLQKQNKLRVHAEISNPHPPQLPHRFYSFYSFYTVQSSLVIKPFGDFLSRPFSAEMRRLTGTN